MKYNLSLADKQFLELAVRQGVVGLSDTRAFYRCSKLRAKIILTKLRSGGYLVSIISGGFSATEKAKREVISL